MQMFLLLTLTLCGLHLLSPAPQSVLHRLISPCRLRVRAVLTQSEGELIKALQLGHQGADCVPGLLLESQVAWVLDRLQTREEPQMLPGRNGLKFNT